MKYSNLTKAFTKPAVLVALSLTLLFNVAIAGGDSYEIFINNKLVMKQFVTQPLSIFSLQLDNAASSATMVVYYKHCGVVGKGRSISIKDEHGVVLKEWKFADAEGADGGMQIPVKEIAALQQKNGQLSLYYSSQLLPGGRMLTAIGKH